MARFLALCLVALPVSATSLPPDEKGRAVKEDQEALQGTWLLVRLEREGLEEHPGRPFKKKKSLWEGATLVFEKDKVRWKNQPPDSYRLDPLKRPSEIDFISEKGSVVLGIYMIEGNKLYICWSEVDGKERPKSFRTKPGQNKRRSLDFKRLEQAANPGSDSLPAGAIARLGSSRVEGTKEKLLVRPVAFFPDGNSVITGHPGVIRFWETRTGKLLRELRAPNVLSFFALAPDGKHLARRVTLQTISICKLDKDREVQRLPETIWRDSMLLFSKDNRTLATCGEKRVILWDAELGQRIREFNAENDVYCLGFSPDGKYLAAAGSGGIAQIWEVRTGEPINRIDLAALGSPFKNAPRHLQVHTTLHSLALSNHGILAISGARTWVYHIRSGKKLFSCDDLGTEVALSLDGRLLACGGEKGDLALWEVVTGERIGVFPGDHGAVWALAFSPNGKNLVSGGSDGTALVWDVDFLANATGKEAAIKSIEDAWEKLSGKAAAGFQAVCWLASRSGQAVPFLQAKLRPQRTRIEDHVRQLLPDLDSPMLSKREAASKALAALTTDAEPVLQKILGGQLSVEQRRRLELALAKLAPSPATLEVRRQIRAVYVLERIASREACLVLETLTKGDPAAPQTREAKAALERVRGDQPQR